MKRVTETERERAGPAAKTGRGGWDEKTQQSQSQQEVCAKGRRRGREEERKRRERTSASVQTHGRRHREQATEHGK